MCAVQFKGNVVVAARKGSQAKLLNWFERTECLSGAKCSSPGSCGADGEGGEDFCVAQRGQARRFTCTLGGGAELGRVWFDVALPVSGG
jgi:hypothetical protein